MQVDTSQLAAAFKALGDPTRLAIFEFLQCCAEPVVIDPVGDVRLIEGPTVGEVCCKVTGIDRITSRISFHLKELRLAGLITMDRHGRNLVCAVIPEMVSEMAAYLSRSGVYVGECCQGEKSQD